MKSCARVFLVSALISFLLPGPSLVWASTLRASDSAAELQRFHQLLQEIDSTVLSLQDDLPIVTSVNIVPPMAPEQAGLDSIPSERIHLAQAAIPPGQVVPLPIERMIPTEPRNLKYGPAQIEDLILEGDQASWNIPEPGAPLQIKLPATMIREMPMAEGSPFAPVLDKYISLALANSREAQAAMEDVELAELRVSAARRVLYPNASVRYTQTTGEISGGLAGFLERDFGLEWSQPLYDSGSSRAGYHQAKLNLRVAQENYRRISTQIRSDIEEAYYQLVNSKLKYVTRTELQEGAVDLVRLAQRQYQAKLSTEVEYLNVMTQYESMAYQIDAAWKDLELARLVFKQRLQVESLEGLDPEPELEFKNVKISLDECTRLAFDHRPDLLVEELLAKVSEYQEDIVEAAKKFRFDINGFYGRSASAFEGEDLIPKLSWFVGLRASKPLGANSMEASYTTQQVRPQLGQSTRTQTNTATVQMGILDAYKLKADAKEASINRHRAENEVEDLEDTILREVYDGYARFEKALGRV
ncbi:MAG: TolC family protein, partial [Candidatus Omnitrophica bacterium]|nr:TolC family protein [Candidatus Omnitrophota bacterium]